MLPSGRAGHFAARSLETTAFQGFLPVHIRQEWQAISRAAGKNTLRMRWRRSSNLHRLLASEKWKLRGKLHSTVNHRMRNDFMTLSAREGTKKPQSLENQGIAALAQMERFELSHRLSQSTPLAGEPLEPLGYICKLIRLCPAMRLKQSWRRERDSNPRCLSTSLVFKTSAINRSAISPLGPSRQQAPCWAALRCITSDKYFTIGSRLSQAPSALILHFPCVPFAFSPIVQVLLTYLQTLPFPLTYSPFACIIKVGIHPFNRI